jgi:hypothetical protein
LYNVVHDTGRKPILIAKTGAEIAAEWLVGVERKRADPERLDVLCEEGAAPGRIGMHRTTLESKIKNPRINQHLFRNVRRS